MTVLGGGMKTSKMGEITGTGKMGLDKERNEIFFHWEPDFGTTTPPMSLQCRPSCVAVRGQS